MIERSLLVYRINLTGSYNTCPIVWKNLLDKMCKEYNQNLPSPKTINDTLSKYNGTYVRYKSPKEPGYIIFQTDEDATMFILAYS